MACKNEECCCKVADLTDLEKQVYGLRLALKAALGEDSATPAVALSDPASVRMYLMIDDAESRIMQKLRDIERQLLTVSVEQWKAEVRAG